MGQLLSPEVVVIDKFVQPDIWRWQKKRKQDIMGEAFFPL